MVRPTAQPLFHACVVGLAGHLRNIDSAWILVCLTVQPNITCLVGLGRHLENI
jgi:hypothetical protein